MAFVVFLFLAGMFLSLSLGLGFAAWKNMSSLNYIPEEEVCKKYGGIIPLGFNEFRDRFERLSFFDSGIRWDFYYLKGEKKTKTIVAVPGISCHWTCVLKFLAPFFLKGWNVCVFDYNSGGSSSGMNKKWGSSMGVKESRVFIRAVEKIYEVFPETKKLVAVGESLGAAIVFMSLPVVEKQNKKIDYVLWDCGFSSAFGETAFLIKRLGFPKLFAYSGAFFAFVFKLFFEGENLFLSSPEKAAKKHGTPVCFIHGKADTVVPFSMTVKMYGKFRVNPGVISRLCLFEGAGHLDSILVDNQLWIDNVFDFIGEEIGEENG